MTTNPIAHRLPPLPEKLRRNRPPALSKKLRDAIELIVFSGADLETAAAQTNQTTYNLRRCFDRPHVLAHLKARREVLRAIVCGSNIHRLREIRDAADNMPAVNAIKELEQIGDEQLNKSAVSDLPHVTIRIVNVASSAPSNKPHEIEHEETRITSDVFSDAIDKKAPPIDAKPVIAVEDAPKRDASGDPIFDQNRRGPFR